MAIKKSKPIETPMDIVAGNVAALIQRNHIDAEELAQLLGYQASRTIRNRLKNPETFTGADLNLICRFFGITLEQLAHDGRESNA